MKQTITIALVILMIGIVTAVYAGETVSLELPQQYEYYSIVGNTTPIVLNVTQEGLNVSITFGKYSQEDEFELVFFDVKEEIIVYNTHSGGGGGGTRRIIIEKNITKVKLVNITQIKEVEKEIETKAVIPGWMKVLLAVLSIIIIFLVSVLLILLQNRSDVVPKKR